MSAIAATLAAVGADAQLLRFAGDTPPPPPGTGADALAMADALDRSIAQILARGDGPGIAAAAGLRRLARDLILAGEKAGAAGSHQTITARTIANHLIALDELLLRPATDAATLEMVAAMLSDERADRFLAAAPDALDRLMRDVLAPLMDLTGPPVGAWGWVADKPAPSGAAAPLTDQDFYTIARLTGVTPEAIDALGRLEERLTLAERWAAYSRAADAVRTNVRGAADALATLNRLAWLSPEARGQAGADFSNAALAMNDPALGMETARAELVRLSHAGRAAKGTDFLSNDAAGKRVRTALSDFLSVRTPDRAAERRSLDAFTLAVAGIHERATHGEREALIRHLRPAWKVLDRDCQAAEGPLIDVLPRILQFESAMTDPAVLTAVAAHRRALDDLASLSSISRVLQIPRAAGAPTDPGNPPNTRDSEPAAGWKPVADRLLKIAQDLSKPADHDVALEQLRAFASRLSRWAELPGESEFRASAGGSYSPPGWGAVTGGRASELPGAIRAARDAWLQDFAQSGSADSTRLDLLAELMTQASAAAAIAAIAQGSAPGRGGGAMEAWPGWELSGRAQASLLGPARDPLARATEQALTGTDGPAAETLASIRKSAPALLLFGRIERRARQLGLGAETGPRAAIGELGCSAPFSDDDWLVRYREDLAAICRYAEEAASPMQPTDPANPAAKAEALRAAFTDYANSRARRVLDELERHSP